MHDPAWQLIVSLLCVAWASVVLVRAAIRLFTSPDQAGCSSGACGSCTVAKGSGEANAPATLVQLKSLNCAADKSD